MQGDEFSQTQGRLELILVPCNFRFSQEGGPLDTVPQDCVADISKQIEYLKSPKLQLLVNNEYFNQQGYGEDSIVRESKLITLQFNKHVPSWIGYQIERNLL